MYDLIITWHEFCNKEENEILRATCITLDAVVEIVKQYNCSPSLHIEIIKRIETTEVCNEKTEECNETKSYSYTKGKIFNIRR